MKIQQAAVACRRSRQAYEKAFRTDRHGNVIWWTDPLGHLTTTERNANGLAVRVTRPDPDGGGPLSAAVTTLAYDTFGRLSTQTNSDSTTRTFLLFVRCWLLLFVCLYRALRCVAARSSGCRAGQPFLCEL